MPDTNAAPRNALYYSFYILSYCPLLGLHVLGTILGWLVYACSRAYRQRLRAHAALAGHTGWGFGWHAAAQAGKGVMELPHVWFRTSHALARTYCADDAVLQTAQTHGRGILFLTPHLGGFEVAARYLAQRAPLTVLFRPPRKTYLTPLMQNARAAAKGLRLAPTTGRGVRLMLRALRQGEAVGLLPDQAPSAGQGVWASFFGREAYSMTLPVRLAQATNACIILSYAVRLSWGRGWTVHFQAWQPDWTHDALVDVLQINHQLERLIQQCPVQYLWAYDRYKTR